MFFFFPYRINIKPHERKRVSPIASGTRICPNSNSPPQTQPPAAAKAAESGPVPRGSFPSSTGLRKLQSIWRVWLMLQSLPRVSHSFLTAAHDSNRISIQGIPLSHPGLHLLCWCDWETFASGFKWQVTGADAVYHISTF